jgi:hypothetical protein
MPFLSSESRRIIGVILFAGFQDFKDKLNRFTQNRTDYNFPVLTFFLQPLLKSDHHCISVVMGLWRD